MRQITKTLYTAAELKIHAPGSFKTAQKAYQQDVAEDDFTANEIFDSLEGLFAAAGVRLYDYQLSAYGRSYLRAEFPGEDADKVSQLKGPRALAWIENHLLGPLRIPYISLRVAREREQERAGLYAQTWAKETTKEQRKTLLAQAKSLRRYTSRLHYKPGSVPDCPFTGTCYDQDFLGALIKDIEADGGTLKSAFTCLADVFTKLLEDDQEYRSTEEAFIETAEANDWEYTEDGERV